MDRRTAPSHHTPAITPGSRRCGNRFEDTVSILSHPLRPQADNKFMRLRNLALGSTVFGNADRAAQAALRKACKARKVELHVEKDYVLTTDEVQRQQVYE